MIERKAHIQQMNVYYYTASLLIVGITALVALITPKKFVSYCIVLSQRIPNENIEARHEYMLSSIKDRKDNTKK
jgi:hypothetical protein